MSYAIRVVALVAVLLLSSRPAAADDKQARARAHFATGIELLDAGDYARALGEFRAAYALWQNPKILLNVGTTLRQLGRHAEAGNAYARYLASPEVSADKKQQAQASLGEIDATVGRLVITTNEADAELLVDGASSTEWLRSEPLRVSPGTHTLVARKSGFAPAVVTVSVAAGESKTVELVLVAKAGEAAAEPSAEPSAKPAEPASPVGDSGPEPGDEPRRLGLFVRADVDGKGRGAVAAPGVAFRVIDQLELGAAGLVGLEKGVWLGVRLLPWKGTLEPSLLVAMPVFFVDGPRVGVQAAAGIAYNVSNSLSVFLDLGVAHFPAPPPGYDATVFLPSIGVMTRL